jgi:hypothetical protein
VANTAGKITIPEIYLTKLILAGNYPHFPPAVDRFDPRPSFPFPELRWRNDRFP